MINKEINGEILKIWKREFSKEKYRDTKILAPLFFDKFKPNVNILFVGANPSFKESNFSFLKDSEFLKKRPEYIKYMAVGENPLEFFLLKIDRLGNIEWNKSIGELHVSGESEYVDTCVGFEECAKEEYKPYFGKRYNEIKKVFTVEPIDLFYYRVTDQHPRGKQKSKPSKDSLKSRVCINPEKEEEGLNPFGKDQVDLFLPIVEAIKPKMILVANSFASRIIQGELRPELKWNEEFGTNTVEIKDKTVPIFFSSPLSGPGVLDTGSYERLRWHIKRTMKILLRLNE
jgi:hypothetical protein